MRTLILFSNFHRTWIQESNWFIWKPPLFVPYFYTIIFFSCLITSNSLAGTACSSILCIWRITIFNLFPEYRPIGFTCTSGSEDRFSLVTLKQPITRTEKNILENLSFATRFHNHISVIQFEEWIIRIYRLNWIPVACHHSSFQCYRVSLCWIVAEI